MLVYHPLAQRKEFIYFRICVCVCISYIFITFLLMYSSCEYNLQCVIQTNKKEKSSSWSKNSNSINEFKEKPQRALSTIAVFCVCVCEGAPHFVLVGCLSRINIISVFATFYKIKKKPVSVFTSFFLFFFL